MKNSLYLPFLLGLSLLALSPLRAQRSFELGGDYGFLFLHSQELAPIGQSYPRGFSLSYQRWLLRPSDWEHCRCFPRLGLSLNWHNYDNHSVLGWGLPLYGFIEPWYRLGGRHYLSVRGGMGLSYNNRPYHPQDNPLNFSYSQKINAFVMLGLGYGYRLNEHWRLGLQMRYNHVSNGGMRYPNKGLNYPSAALQIDYSPEALRLISGAPKSFDADKALRQLSLELFSASQAGGTAGEAETSTRISYLVAGAQLRYLKQVSRLSAFTLGAEWLVNYAYERKIRREGLSSSHHQAGFMAGHAFILGKFVFSQEAGFYLLKEYGAGPDWYQRYGLLYYPWPNLGFGPNIRVHGHVAEFIDFRLSYRLPW